MRRVVIEHLPRQGCIARYDAPHTLFVLDPPCWQTEGLRWRIFFEEYERLAETMAGMKGVRS